MDIHTVTLPDDTDALKAMIIAFAEKEKSFQQRIEDLEEHIRLLKNEIFGGKSEKWPKSNQKHLTLFGQTEPEPEPEPELAEEKTTIYDQSRKKRGRRPLKGSTRKGSHSRY